MWKVFALLLFALTGNAYDFSLPSPGGTINLSDYQGKYILLVNTASNSQYTAQYGQLEQLYQEFKDSLVVIAIPSDDFGNEPLADTALQDSIINTFNLHYPVAGKMHITGDSISSLYGWLNNQFINAGFNGSISGDFEKILIDKSGNFKGIFAPSVSPVSDEMRNNFLPPSRQHYLMEGN